MLVSLFAINVECGAHETRAHHWQNYDVKKCTQHQDQLVRNKAAQEEYCLSTLDFIQKLE